MTCLICKKENGNGDKYFCLTHRTDWKFWTVKNVQKRKEQNVLVIMLFRMQQNH